MSEKSGGEFINFKYPDLQKSPQVERSVKKEERIKGLKTPNHPTNRNEVFIDRLENIFENPDTKTKERNIELFKNQFLYPAVLIDKNNIPDSYFELQLKIARDRGQAGDLGHIQTAKDIPIENKRQTGETLYNDQKQSLDIWTDYLTSNDSIYPTWFKYYTLRSITKMGNYNKETHEFSKRSKTSTGIFPDLNREALSYTYDTLSKHYLKGEKQNDSELKKVLDSANFSKIYSFAMEKITPASKENKEKTEGSWTKFDQGSEPMALCESLQGHGTNWCTAGEQMARSQLNNGDFYVYYTKDEDSHNTIPRIAIRMENGQVAEVRGVADKDQNLEGNMSDIASEKYHQLPGGEKFDKKNHDMKLLNLIDTKAKDNQELTKEELRFLYELDFKIEGFGYRRDPRIKELCSTRDSEKDMPIIFGCSQEQIAHNQEEINLNTKAYVGKLFPGIFNQLSPQIEYIYTSFPENKIVKDTVTIGGKNVQALEQKLQKVNIQITILAQDILDSNEFTTFKIPEKIDLIKLEVSDLGFTDSPTTDQLYQRVNELGLELCPAEVGPHYRLKYTDQPLNEWLRIGMKQISDSDDSPHVFELSHDDDGLWLDTSWSNPTYEWDLDDRVVFSLRK